MNTTPKQILTSYKLSLQEVGIIAKCGTLEQLRPHTFYSKYKYRQRGKLYLVFMLSYDRGKIVKGFIRFKGKKEVNEWVKEDPCNKPALSWEKQAAKEKQLTPITFI